MSFFVLDTAMGSALYQALGEQVTYRRCTGEVLTAPPVYAVIDLDMDQFGDSASGATEYRTEIGLLRADIGTAQRGDTIITADGTTYTVQDVLPGQTDKVEIKVSVK